MKQISILVFWFIVLIISSCKGQAPLKISGFKFESIFGSTTKEPGSTYCLLGTGFLRTPRSDNSDSLIYDWMRNHPDAMVIPVSSFGTKSKMIYCWVIDKTDTLNNYLIKAGCFPGGTMMRPNTWDEMQSWEKKLYEDAGEEVDVEVHVDRQAYDVFIEQIKNDEIYAQKNKLGIWLNETDE